MHEEPDTSQSFEKSQSQKKRVFENKAWKEDIEMAFVLHNSLRIIPDVICP